MNVRNGFNCLPVKVEQITEDFISYPMCHGTAVRVCHYKVKKVAVNDAVMNDYEYENKYQSQGHLSKRIVYTLCTDYRVGKKMDGRD